MANPATQSARSEASNCDGAELPIDPFLAVHYHFGMLLGVEEFENPPAYARGKMRLHNAWLHREGVVWGLGVTLDAPSGEVRVEPGLATDSEGRELYLDERVCLGVDRWIAERVLEDEELLGRTIRDKNATSAQFAAYIAIRFRSCLTRQVPALRRDCDASDQGVSYSRVLETVKVEILPAGLEGEPPRILPLEAPYPLLRILTGLAGPDEEADGAEIEARDERLRILALPPAERHEAFLAAVRRFAALDTVRLRPGKTGDGEDSRLFPAEDQPVLLARVDFDLGKQNGVWKIQEESFVDNGVRPAHVAARTLLDFVAAGIPLAPVGSAVGPRIDADNVEFKESGGVIYLHSDLEIVESTLTPEAFQVAVFSEAGGWEERTFEEPPRLLNNSTTTIRLAIDSNNKIQMNQLTRVVARGEGLRPVMGTTADGTFLPLAGAQQDAPVRGGAGRDFTTVVQRSS